MRVFIYSKHNLVVFSMACLAVMSVVAVSEASYWRSVERLTTIGEIAAARTNVQKLLQGLLNAETGQRGFLLTGRDEYLQPYELGLKAIDNSLASLDAYYERHPASKPALIRLRDATHVKLSELKETLRLNNEGKREAALQVILSDIGKEKMESIRQLSAELIDEENGNVAKGREDVFQTLALSRVGVIVLSALGLLALFFYLRQTSALAQQREVQRHLVQAERDRLEREVEQRTQQLTELADHLQTAREDERHRLARNLHDELGALLTSAKLDAARIRPRLAGAAPEALERLNHLVDTLNSSIALGRRIIEDLRPSTLSNLGLLPTLEILARDFSTTSGITVHCELEPAKLDSTAELVVYRMVQEAITNIAKYAQARNVWIGLSSRDGHAKITVRDDGVGFDTSMQPRSAYGLVGMRYRVEAEGGSLALESAIGQGTLIRVTLPESEFEAD